MSWLRVALCQLGPVVGDLPGNVELIVRALGQAEDAGADLAVFPELAITGYPPEDLLLKPGFVADNAVALSKVAQATDHCAAIVGFVDESLDLFNAAAVCAQGEVRGVYHKRNLPNYSVFDERRYFLPGGGARELYLIGGVRVGVSICEDAWDPTGPVSAQAAAGAELIVNINASPYYAQRWAERQRMLATRAADASCALLYLNMVGGQDELVFDGASMIFGADGHLVGALPQFTEEVAVFDLEVRPAYRKRLLDPRGRHLAAPLPEVVVSARPRQMPSALHTAPPQAQPLGPDEEIYRALVMGTHDYVRRNGFSDVVIGLSGGIDSSLVAAVAADALGPQAVHGVSMPSRFTSEHSNDDAADLALRLGIDHRVVPIEPAYSAVLSMLAPSYSGTVPGLAEENIQSRLRGVVLMALSNKFGWLVLATGNKSEMSVGYTTLYGDLAGGFAVIKDVPKTLVYRLSRWRNDATAAEVAAA
ncbi:MAG TPA: NAD+ synthase, partial [Acidimicrobiales bacterium]|nr:NAD+ synthase [Acidimicrobiales bacterium]